jgi:hypothetical protein
MFNWTSRGKTYTCSCQLNPYHRFTLAKYLAQDVKRCMDEYKFLNKHVSDVIRDIRLEQLAERIGTNRENLREIREKICHCTSERTDNVSIY